MKKKIMGAIFLMFFATACSTTHTLSESGQKFTFTNKTISKVTCI